VRAFRVVASALCLAAVSARADSPSTGFIHVRAAVGAQVKLDGKLKGVIDSDEGLVLREIAPGVHQLHAFLTGHEDQHLVLNVEAGTVSLAYFRPFQPVPEHRLLNGPAESIKTGALWIEAIAHAATVDSKKLGWKKIALNGEPFVAANVPEGEHKITFCNPEKCIDYRAKIRSGDTLALMVDFGMSNIHNVSSLRKNQWTRAKEACSSGADRAACMRACNVDAAFSPNGRSLSCESAGAALEADTLAVNVAMTSLTPPCEPLGGGKKGAVTITTTPPAELFLGSVSLGETPLSRVQLPAGCVEVRAVAHDKRTEKTIRLEVDPEQVTVYMLEL
jgi:hypothetical protein